MDQSTTTATLTPSELILLKAEEFVKPARVFGIKLFGSEAKLDLDELARLTFAAAFLTDEKNGAARLEQRTESRLFGLLHPRNLYFEPTEGGSTPIPDTLEASLLRTAGSLVAKKQNTIRGVVYVWMGKDVASPRRAAIDWIEAQMAKRGLLDVTEGKMLGVIKQLHYRVPERTRDLAAQQSIEPLRQLFSAYQQDHPDEWKQLRSGIDTAMAERKIQVEGGAVD